MIARYLFTCLGLVPQPVSHQEIEQKQVGILGEHDEPRRFRGTKVYVKSKSISPDYMIDANIHHTDRGGLDVWITWGDINGRVHGPYLLQPDDEIKVISIRDAKALAATPAPAPVVRQIQQAREQREKKSKNPLEKLSGFLRKNDIGNKLLDDRISLIMGKYYIECVEDKFELSDVRRGLIGSYEESKEGASRLLKKLKKLESKVDYEKILEKMGEQ